MTNGAALPLFSKDFQKESNFEKKVSKTRQCCILNFQFDETCKIQNGIFCSALNTTLLFVCGIQLRCHWIMTVVVVNNMYPSRRIIRRRVVLFWSFFVVPVFVVLLLVPSSLHAWSPIKSSPCPSQRQSSRRLLHDKHHIERRRGGVIRAHPSLLDDDADCTSSMLDENDRHLYSSAAATAATTSRRSCLVAAAFGVVASTLAIAPPSFSPFTFAPLAFNTIAALAFEGGIGGLGKTKPETGVQFWNPDLPAPVQNSPGVVAAELNINHQPVLVSFWAPWPILATTAGLEARDLQLPESAFVQVITKQQGNKKNVVVDLPTTKTQARDLLLNSVLGPQGKFGAYGTPVDVKVKAVDIPANLNKNNKQVVVYRVSFTAYTPGLRETDRQALVAFHRVSSSADALVLLVAGTTQLRFAQKQEQLLDIISSLEVVAAPTTTRKP
jgi:hypothetical protein